MSASRPFIATRLLPALAAVTLLLAVSASSATLDDVTAEASREMVTQLGEFVPIQGKVFLVRPELFLWEGIRLDLPVVRAWRESLAAELTQSGATLTTRPSGASWKLRGNASTDGKSVTLTLSCDSVDNPGQTRNIRRAIPQSAVENLLRPDPAQIASFLVATLDRQNQGFAVPVQVLPPVPAPGELPRNLGGWLQAELTTALAAAQSLHLSQPTANPAEAHQLRVEYSQEGTELRFVATINVAKKDPWGRSSLSVPLSAFPRDVVRIRFPSPVRIAWREPSAEETQATVPKNLRQSLIAALRLAGVLVVRHDDDLPASYELRARFDSRLESNNEQALRRGVASLTGDLTNESRSCPWESKYEYYIRPNQGEGPFPEAYSSAVADAAALSIFQAVMRLTPP